MSREGYRQLLDKEEAQKRAACFCHTQGFQCNQGRFCPLRETELDNDVAPDASRSFSGSIKDAGHERDLAWFAAILILVGFWGWLAWCWYVTWANS